MTSRDEQGSQRKLHVLRPLPGTEGKAAFSVSDAVLARIRLNPQDAAGLSLADVLHLIHTPKGA